MPRIVPSEGPLNANIALIGEAPGAEEDRHLRPFIGDSGVQLNNFLQSVGLLRTDLYITNVVKERPPHNEMITFATGLPNTPQGHKALTKLYQSNLLAPLPAYCEYEAQLYAELSQCKANVLVPMGNWALYALTRKWGIDKWRGSQLAAVSELNGRKVIPTYHPAATLPSRDFLAQYPLKMDLRRVKEHSAFPELRIPQRTLHTFPSFGEAIGYIDHCNSLAEVGFDIEAKPCGGTKKQPETWEMSCFSLAHSAFDSMCIPIIGPNGFYWDEEQHLAVLRALARLLTNKGVLKVGQNLIFDSSFNLRKIGTSCWPIYDTMVAQRILLPDLPAGLDFLCAMYTETPYYKDDGKQEWRDPSNWLTFYEYSAMDSAICMDIKPKQMADLERGGHTATYERTIRMHPSLLFMGERGVRSDEATIEELKTSVQGELDVILEKIMVKVRERGATYMTGGKTPKEKEFDSKLPTSPQQGIAYFYGVLKNTPYKNKEGGITIDDEAVIRLARKGIEEASDTLAYRKLFKLKTSYLDALLDNGRFRCQWKPNGADTGRLSSASDIFGYGLNLQTIPREGPFKKMFLPDEGYVLIQMDMSQAEARILAYCGGVHPKIEAYERGLDVYCITASRIATRLGYSLSAADILEQHEAKIMAPIAGGKKSWRGWGKECDLALGYNMGPDTFSRRTEMPLSDARLVHGAWHQVYPEVRGSYHAMITKMLNADRNVINPFGRRRKFLGMWSAIGEPAYAHFCQSTVADAIMENALIPLAERQDLFAPAELLLQIHDAVVWQVPLTAGWSRIATLVSTLKALMERPITWRGVTFTIPSSVGVSGRSLGHCVELGAKRVSAETLSEAYQQSIEGW